VVVHELTDTTNLSLALKHLLDIKREGLLLTKLAGIKGSRRKWPVWCGVQGLGGCKLPPKTTTLFPSGPPLPSFLGWGLSPLPLAILAALFFFQIISVLPLCSVLLSSAYNSLSPFVFSKPAAPHLLLQEPFFCFSDHLTFLASSHLESTCRPPLDASSQIFCEQCGRKRKHPLSIGA
jgi:hypothetical protein